MNPKLKELREKSMKLPLQPGVYIMKDKTGNIIYIGKAKHLKNRVSQYFGSQARHEPKVLKMVEHVDHFDYIVTDSEFEALILECSLIKQNQPKYNILLKDDKGYHYIKVTPPPFRRISAVHQIEDDGAQYIGPYSSSFVVSQTVEELRKMFRLPTCNRSFTGGKKQRPCLNFHIGNCCAPCAGKIAPGQYDELVEDALRFIRTGSEETLLALERRMEQAAENLEFEKAAQIRDRIAAIKRITEKQKVVFSRVKEQDVICVVQGAGSACFEVFRFQAGSLCDDQHFIVEESADLPAARTEFMERFYSLRGTAPPNILVDGELENEELLTEWLSSRAGRRVKIHKPQRGENARLLEMCRNNASEHLAISFGRAGRETKALDELARLLGLPAPPERIEAYDISNTAGSENVAGMVVFRGGKPLRSDYRRFKIKGFEGQDDYASLRETIARRFARYEKEKECGESFGVLPDLILLDGGAGQLSAVKPVLEEMGFGSIPTFGMVKDSKHKTRAVTGSGGEIEICRTRAAFTLVSEIQEEVHRFAVTYHRVRRKKSILTSLLTSIEGVGEARAKALLHRFRTVSAIREAEPEALADVPGMTRKTAGEVYRFFHPPEEKD